jgi:hypothetical protein
MGFSLQRLAMKTISTRTCGDYNLYHCSQVRAAVGGKGAILDGGQTKCNQTAWPVPTGADDSSSTHSDHANSRALTVLLNHCLEQIVISSASSRARRAPRPMNDLRTPNYPAGGPGAAADQPPTRVFRFDN